MTGVISPQAPGGLGVQATPPQMMTYLDELGQWVQERRAELDQIDHVAQGSAHNAEVTPDIRLALSLWQSISQRHGALLATWDSGRVGPKQLEQLSQMIWGRLGASITTTSSGDLQGMSLPEATRLSDALTQQLRTRLQVDPGGSQVQARIRDLRAQLERLRDQISLEPDQTAPAARAKLADLAARIDEAGDKASRGGDVGGLLAPLEAESATFERDLIVGGANRRSTRLTPERALEVRNQLATRAAGVRELADQVAHTVLPAPRYAVPQVDALGPVPAGGVELTNYSSKLTQVAKALDVVEEANRVVLATLEAARQEVAHQRNLAPDEVDADLLTAVDAMLALRPTPIDAVTSALAALQHYERYQQESR